MSAKSHRQTARDAVTTFHASQLAELVTRVGDSIDGYRAGRMSAFDVDQVLLQYSRAAKELWKFCNMPDVEFTANMIQERPPGDWWERGAQKKR